MAVETPIGEDVKLAAAEALARVADVIAGRVYSPRIKLLDIHRVCEATGLGEKTIYRMIAAGTFPRPLKDVGKNVWRESTIVAWADGKDPDHGKEWA